MPKGKKREATPKAPKVSPASVDAPPAPLNPPIGWGGKTVFPVEFGGKPSSIPPIEPPGDTKTDIPEELAPVWDTEIAAIFAGMKLQHQDFLLCYLREGNAAAAYRHAYNKMAKDHLAAVCGSQVLTTADISKILAKFASIKTEALFTVIAGYREMAQATKPNFVQDKDGQWSNAGDLPDWQARKEALIGIRKIHGLDAAEKVDHTVKAQIVHIEAPPKKPEGYGSPKPG